MKDQESNAESNVWCKSDGEKEDRGTNGDVGIEGNGGLDMAKANAVRWYGNVLRRDERHVLRKVLKFEEKGKRKRGRPKKTWKTQEEESKSVGLEKEDAINRVRWRVGVGEIAVRVG
mgnify:CR=1 FL=1